LVAGRETVDPVDPVVGALLAEPLHLVDPGHLAKVMPVVAMEVTSRVVIPLEAVVVQEL
jgi:hypothetical protein